MFKKTFAAAVTVVSVLCATSASQAQDFCGLDGAALLKTLDGTWKIRQKPGVAVVPGVMKMPIKDQKVTTATFKFNPDLGASKVVGFAEVNSMLLYVMNDGDVAFGEVAMSNAKGVKTSGCNPKSVPMLSGTNYQASDKPYRDADAKTIRTCKKLYESGVSLLWNNASTFAAANEAEACSKLDAAKGKVTTTMIMQFTSPTSGYGTVIFNGNAQGSGQNMSFTGVAPITLEKQK